MRSNSKVDKKDNSKPKAIAKKNRSKFLLI